MRILLIAFFFCSLCLFAQNKRYSCSFFGTNLYAKPSERAKLINSVPFGDSVEFLSPSKKEETVISKSGFPLKDHWASVKYKGQKGYVFGADLSVRKAEASLFEAENPGYLGKLIEGRMLDMGWVGNYERGYRLTRYNDGCSDEEVLLRGYSLNEVYHILMQSYSGITGSEFPHYLGQLETVFNFDGVGATISIFMEPLPQGQFRITSYACD